MRIFRYEEIAEELRDRIRTGDFGGGSPLPSERELMQQFGVQRNTVRQALNLLEADGWITAAPKRGWFVSATAVEPLAATAGATILLVNAWNNASVAVEHLLQGLSKALETIHLTVTRFDSRPRAGNVTHALPTPEYLTANHVVGVVLWPQNPADLPALGRLRAAAPLVLVDRRVLGFEADSVGCDDISGGRMVTEHLIAKGHRRIGFLADEAFAETVQQRWRGYTQALEAAGVPPDLGCLLLFHGIHAHPFAEYARLFLAGNGDPLTAVVCSNDTTALQLIRFLRAEGRRVPEDVAVTGYGNLLPDYLDALELTTVEQNFTEVGRVAGNLLRDRLILRRETAPTAVRQVQLPVRLIVRRSSGSGAGM